MKAIFTFILLVVYQFGFAQLKSMKARQKPEITDTIIVERGDSSLVVPIEFEVVRKNTSAVTVIADVSPDNYKEYFSLRKDTVKINDDEETVAFYVEFVKKVKPRDSSKFELIFSLSDNSLVKKVVLVIKPEPKLIYTLNDYLNKDSLLLDKVTKAESKDNILTVYGYRKGNDENIVTRKVILNKEKPFRSWERNYILSVSVITVPFKIRPGFGDYRATAQAGLTNIGLNFGKINWKWDRYRSDASKISRKLSIGAWIAPSVEELDAKSLRTSGLLADGEKSKQMFWSTGLTLTYTVNSLSFVLVPAGFDIPTSKLGKQWIYRGQYWWGFGLALEPKFLASVFNK